MTKRESVVVESGDTVMSGESQHLHAVGRLSRRIAMRGALEAPPALLQSTPKGWNASYGEGAMFIPELVECDVAMGSGGVEGHAACDSSSGEVRTGARCTVAMGEALRGPTTRPSRYQARPTALHSAATAIMDVVHGLRDEQLRQSND